MNRLLQGFYHLIFFELLEPCDEVKIKIYRLKLNGIHELSVQSLLGFFL